MKSKEFNVPADLIVEFAEVLTENELVHAITGTTADDEIIIEVDYEKSERQAIFELMELLEEEDDE